MERTGQLGKSRLGDLLVRQGLITHEQLETALKEQEASHAKLGELLVRDLVLTEEDIARALAEQMGYEHVNLAAVPIQREAATLVPLRIARGRQLVPIRLEGRVLTVAVADPLNVQALDEVELLTGYEVQPVVATPTQVRFAIEKYVAGADAIQHLEATAAQEEPEEEPHVGEPGAAVVRLVNQIIREAVVEQASDLHIEPQAGRVLVRYRVDGVLRDAMELPKSVQPELLSRIKIMADLDITERRRPQDGRIALKVDDARYDLRVATLPTPEGEAVTVRILDRSGSLRRLDEVGLAPQDMERLLAMVSRPYGALFVSGPTGSGKTSTLYALLAELVDGSRKLITLEDPIEYVMPGVTQVAVNPRIGLTFPVGLRTVLRCDPDIVLVGEVRDGETAETAVRAALTGHLVLSSIHTNDAPSVLTRLADMGVPPYVTSAGLIGAVAQRLVRRLCPACRAPVATDPETLRAHGFSDEEASAVTVFEANGCPECGHTGYRGRIAVFEIMEFTEELQKLYLANASTSMLREVAVSQGMRPLRRDALDKVAAGITSLSEVARVVP